MRLNNEVLHSLKLLGKYTHAVINALTINKSPYLLTTLEKKLCHLRQDFLLCRWSLGPLNSVNRTLWKIEKI